MKIGSIEFSPSGRRFGSLTSIVIAAMWSAGCVSTTPPEGANDPSSARAQTAPAVVSSPVLDEGHAPLPEAATSAAQPSSAHDHAAHDHAAHDHAAHDPDSHRDHAADTEAAAKPPAPAHQKQAQMYACPMHPEVRQAGAGRCPKCGMPLELEKPEAETKE